MAQTWIPNTSGELDSDNTLSDSRGYINDALDALRSAWSGSAAPTSPTPLAGQFFYDTDDNILYVYTGSTWRAIGDYDATYGGLLPLSAGASYPLTGDLYCGAKQLKNIANASAATDAVAFGQADARYLELDGSNGPMTGSWSMGSYFISCTAAPTDASHLARKGYVDTQALAGGTYTGNINLASTYRVQNVPAPSAASDAVSRSYVQGCTSFDTSSGHDHDGSDAKKVLWSNLDTTGASAGSIITSDGAGGITALFSGFTWGHTAGALSVSMAYQEASRVTISVPSTSNTVLLIGLGVCNSMQSNTLGARIQRDPDGSPVALATEASLHEFISSTHEYASVVFQCEDSSVSGSQTYSFEVIGATAVGTIELRTIVALVK